MAHTFVSEVPLHSWLIRPMVWGGMLGGGIGQWSGNCVVQVFKIQILWVFHQKLVRFCNFSSYGVYCERKNNGERCQDYKYRLCCKKNDKTKSYGKWGKWGACTGSCEKDQGERTRTRDCLKLKDGSYRPNCELIHVGPKKLEKWVVFDKTECTRTDPECRGDFPIWF